MVKHSFQFRQRTQTILCWYVRHSSCTAISSLTSSKQWPQWKKTSILIICSLYSFLGNSALLGPSVYISVWTTDFNITPSKASGLVSYPNLTFGCGSLLLVPAYIKFGRRPVMLLSLVLVSNNIDPTGEIGSHGLTNWWL